MVDGGWYVAKGEGGEELGPYGNEALRHALLNGEIAPDDLLWRDGMPGWEQASAFLWFAVQAEPEAMDAETDVSAAADIDGDGVADAPFETAPAPRIDPPELGDGPFATFRGHDLTLTAADLEAFVGVNAKPYLAFREKLAKKGGKIRFVLPWSWPAFFLPLAWLAYRRFYWWIITIAAVSWGAVAVEKMFPILGSGFQNMGVIISVVVALSAKKEVLVRANKAAQFADQLGLAGDKRTLFLAREGGVSRIGGWVVAVAHIVFFAYLGYLAWAAFAPKGWTV